MPLIVVLAAVIAFAMIGYSAISLARSSPTRHRARRMKAISARHGANAAAAAEATIRRIQANRATRLDTVVMRLLPNPAKLQERLSKTGKGWTVGQYGTAMAVIFVVVALAGLLRGLPVLYTLVAAVVLAVALPHKVVGMLIARRVKKFISKFPDAIELLVRGLRSGLPIAETMGVVATEIDGPVGVEFRSITDKMKIGRSMDAAMQETADRLGTPDFQFFVISIAIQRETGGNLAETLANLATVLRQRGQMKLKIKAMSSESKASAYIVGSLPFIVFGLVWAVNPGYMANFFVDQRLVIAGIGGLVWMGIGAFIMARMVNFEI